MVEMDNEGVLLFVNLLSLYFLLASISQHPHWHCHPCSSNYCIGENDENGGV